MPEVIIRARAPFDFAATARFLRFTEAEAVDTFHAGRYARAHHFDGRLYLLTVEPRGTDARPALAVALTPTPRAASDALHEAAQTVARMFSVEHDLMTWRARAARDPLMRELEATHRGLRLARWPTLFETLFRSIMMQQIATTVAITLTRRVVERYGATLAARGQKYFAFPQAHVLARLDVSDLRASGLTTAKATSIIELARACAGGALDAEALARQDNEAIIARLVQLRGIGRWTAEWALLLYFGRTDIFPAGDLFLRGVVAKYYNKGEAVAERELRARAHRRWGAWASYAVLYFVAGLRAGRITLKAERVLSSHAAADAPLPRVVPTSNRRT